jgi:hypothetical protein
MDGAMFYALGFAAAIGYFGFSAVALAALLKAAGRIAN